MEEFKTPSFSSYFTIGLVRVILALSVLFLVRFQLVLPAIISFLLLITIESMRIWSRHGIRKLSFSQAAKPSRLFPDEKVKIVLQWKNNKILPFILEWKQVIPPQFQVWGDAQKLSGKKVMRWYETTAAEFTLKATKRGSYIVNPPQIISRDGLGLFETEGNDLGQAFEILVYPKLLSFPEINLNPLDLIGQRPDRRPILPDPINISGLREYTPDMPARLIQWKASAQKDILLAKVQEATSDLRLCVAVDVDAFLTVEKNIIYNDAFENALSLAATLVCSADEQGIPIGFLANAPQSNLDTQAIIPIGSGPNQAAAILECLARLEFKSSLPLARLLNLVPFYSGTTLVVLGDGVSFPKPPGVFSMVNYSCITQSVKKAEENYA